MGNFSKLAFAFLSISFFIAGSAADAFGAPRGRARAAAPKANGPQFKHPIQFKKPFGVHFEIDLHQQLVDPTFPEPLTWSKGGNPPAWLELNEQTGILSGTPTTAGIHSFNLSVTQGQLGDTDHPATFEVMAPPVWDGPLQLGVMNEGVEKHFDLLPHVQNPPGGNLAFTGQGLPPWLKIVGNELVGTPSRSNVGPLPPITITATGIGGSASTPATGFVQRVINWPHWKAAEITLTPEAKEDFPYSTELVDHVAPGEAAVSLSYQIKADSVTPPPWLEILPNKGTLSGTPRAENVKLNEIVIRLDMSAFGETRSELALFKLNVIHTNHPPKWRAKTIPLPSQTNGQALQNVDLSKSVDDQDHDPLKFKIVSFTGPAGATNWAEIDENTGVLTGTPDKSQVGNWAWVISAIDPGLLSDTTTVTITITKKNEPPQWKRPVVILDAKEDFPYHEDLNQKKYVVDEDPADKLTFTKISGPAWIEVSTSGHVSGIPHAADLLPAPNVFTVTVTDNVSGSDTAPISMMVIHTNHTPKWSLGSLNVPVIEESSLGGPEGLDVRPYAIDDDIQDTLKASMISGPAWVKFDPATWKLTGTPVHGTATHGINKVVLRLGDDQGTFASPDFTVNVDVIHKNHAPTWQPVTLSDATEDTAYSPTPASVAQFASDSDGDGLLFSKDGGPDWLTVATNGTLGGTPHRADVGGPFEVRFKVTDNSPEHASAVVVSSITVKRINKPPYWVQDPIPLGTFDEDSSVVNRSVAQFATDPDGDIPLKFELVKYEGPGQQSPWTFIGQDGSLTGVPQKAHIGTFTLTIKVSDPGGLSATAKAFGEVRHVNHPPVIAQGFRYEMKERTVPQIQMGNPPFSDIDDDKLEISLVDASTWVEINGTTLKARPTFAQIGAPNLEFRDHVFVVRVSDGQIPVFGSITIRVIRDPRAPQWLQNPIEMTAMTGIDVAPSSVASLAKDLDGIPIHFTKDQSAQHPWLKMDSDGNLTGAPQDTDLGLNTFTLNVCNDKLCSSAQLKVTVIPGEKKDKFAIDTPVPGAPVDLLWVVDNNIQPPPSDREAGPTRLTLDRLAHVFRDSISAFFTELGDLHHSGIYLSSDVEKHHALPIHVAPHQPMLMTWETPSLIPDFQLRVNTGAAPNPCPRSSPVFSMFRFYEQVPTISEIYHNGYMTPHIPMDVLMVTHRADEYPFYAAQVPELKKYTPEHFARDFIEFHKDQEKPYRVSAIAPSKPPRSTVSGVPVYSGPEYTYRTIVDRTHGSYFPLSKASVISSDLKQYAKEVKFHAYVNANRFFQLSQNPKDLASIQVSVAGVPLAPDQWGYDAGTNKVEIFWWLVDQGSLKPGDQLEIKYRIS